MANVYTVAKAKPRWHQVRWRLSNLFIRIARKIKPDNPELQAWMMDALMDQMVYGQHMVRLDPLAFERPEPDGDLTK